MKPSIENVRKVAEQEHSIPELALLEDYLGFFIAGAKEGMRESGHSVNEIAELLDHARATQEFIRDRIRLLGKR